MIYKNAYALMALSLFLFSCHAKKGKEKEAPAAIEVITQPVQYGNVSDSLSISGNIEGSRTARLGFLVAGKINHIIENEGRQVRRGQLIATLDPANYQLAKNQADIAVAQAQDQYRRIKLLHDRKSASDDDFAKVGFAVEQARAQQRSLAKNISDTRLYSSLSGIVLKKLSEVGEIVGQGTPVLVISNISTVHVDAYIPENQLHDVTIGEKAAVTIAALGRSFTGRVTEVSGAADPASRAFTVKVDVANPGLLIRPGMIAEVKFPSKTGSSLITVPTEVIVHGTDNQNYVFVADLQKKQAFKRKVSVGRLVGNRIEITSGLDADDQLVIAGQNKLTDGTPVTIKKQ